MLKVITIDGPASSGKSTIGFLFSKKINFTFIDTGAIYRAGSLVILKNNLPLDNEQQNAEIFRNLNLTFTPGEDKNNTILDGKDITGEISSEEVTKIVPIIASQKSVREAVKYFQHQAAQTSNLVVAGRDIGTEVFPDADLKFFIDCDVQIRAERRLKQLQNRGLDITFEVVLKEIQERDLADSTRQNSPFRKPEDAVIVDTSNLSIEQTVEELLKHFSHLTK